MGYKTKVQSIKRKNSEQFYINFPMVLAQALELGAGEEIEWVVAEDGKLLVQRQPGRQTHRGKNESPEAEGMTEKFWGLCRPAFRQRCCWENAGTPLSGILLNMGRHTISRSISSAGAAGRDWSAAYRLFERERVNTGNCSASSGKRRSGRCPVDAPAVAFIDDTL